MQTFRAKLAVFTSVFSVLTAFSTIGYAGGVCSGESSAHKSKASQYSKAIDVIENYIDEPATSRLDTATNLRNRISFDHQLTQVEKNSLLERLEAVGNNIAMTLLEQMDS